MQNQDSKSHQINNSKADTDITHSSENHSHDFSFDIHDNNVSDATTKAVIDQTNPITINKNSKTALIPNSDIVKKPLQPAFLHPKYWGIWLAFMLFLPLVWLPLAFQFAIGRWMGALLFAVAKKRRQVTLVNLQLAYPNKTDDERLIMAKDVFINQGIGIFETLSAWLRPSLFDNTTEFRGLENIQTPIHQQQAVILLGGHYTMLDLGGLLASRYVPTHCLYRPQNNQLLEWFIHNRRSNIFHGQISSRDTRSLIKTIKNGNVVWYTPDQDFGLKQGVMADFFGVPAATVTAPRRLAKLGNKQLPPIVMAVHFYRASSSNLGLFDKPKYVMTFTPALDNYPTNDEVQDATRVNKLLEDLINLAPTQWMWFHKRYKTGENGRSKYYD